MPRSAGIAVENSFVKGLITEATGLSFPENACTETFDCIFKKTGEVTRRLGFDYEEDYTLFSAGARSKSAMNNYLWTGAGGDGNSTFLVQQRGRYIYFYAVEERALSPNKHSTAIDLNNFDIAGNEHQAYACEFAQGDGKLFVVGQYIEPFYVTYTPSSDTISSGTQITIEIRDFEGDSADTYAVDERPTATVTTDTQVVNAHLYNLMNQGWADAVYVDTPGQANPLKDWDAAETTLPSNSDRWWQLKNADDQMDMGELDKFPVTTGEAPKGHFIFNAFNVNRGNATGSDVSGGSESFDELWGRAGGTWNSADLTDTTTDARPSQIAFFANRVWYAGVNDNGYNSKLYFSQILDNISKAGKCYQDQDPTSEVFYELVPSDGGVIEIPEIARIVKLFVVSSTLYVFATNGIWEITGSEGIGFTATDFSVNKVSSIRCEGNKSYIDINGAPSWINSEGIWVLQGGTLGQPAQATNISKDTIQDFFEEIPLSSLPYVKGVYNQRTRIAYWMYRSVEADALDDNYQYDRVLVFNTDTGAFYPWKLNTTANIKVLDIAVTYRFFAAVGDSTVTVGGDTVQDSGNADVTVEGGSSASVVGDLKFLVENASNGITWAESYKDTFLDWATPLSTGRDYESYFITGFKVRGDGIRKQQTGYVRIHSRVETNSSLKVQGVWDYYTSDGARWSTEQQAYKTKTNGTYSDRRLKIRGHGLALQMKFKSETGKPFNVTGWSSYDLAENTP